MLHFARLALGVVVTAVVLAACGGDGSNADSELVQALVTEWIEDEAFDEGVDIDCVAKGFVDGIGGADGAAEYGVNKDNIADADFDEDPLTEEDALAASAGMFECDGLKVDVAGTIAPVEGEDAECLADELSDETLIGLFATNFVGDNSAGLEERFENAFEEEFFAGMETCGIEG